MVVDASCLVHLLLRTPKGSEVAKRLAQRPSVHAPEVVDLEVLSALRRLEARAQVSPDRAAAAIVDLRRMPLVRHRHTLLSDAIWRLRGRVSPYDAAYLALGAWLGVTILTADAKLAGAPGLTVAIETV